jgi:D-3-phosphoglycerate dehydrogenase
MPHRCAILDDYQNVALRLGDWSRIARPADVTVFKHPLGRPEQVIAALKDFAIVCLMRERTLFGRQVIENLPNLKLIVASGMRNAAIDMHAAAERNVTVCGTASLGHPTAELTFGLMLELARQIGRESARMKSGVPWQTTLGIDLAGKTLGIVGLGKLGSRVAAIARALEMRILAWSQNLTEQQCRNAGARLVSKDELFRQADIVTVHLQLSERTHGLIGAQEFSLMKPSAFLINTSRGPIVQEAALLEALRTRRIAGAGIDVYDVEPLPLDHPLRQIDNVVLTPHLGYVTEDNYRRFYGEMIEDIRAWLDGAPIRVIKA